MTVRELVSASTNTGMVEVWKDIDSSCRRPEGEVITKFDINLYDTVKDEILDLEVEKLFVDATRTLSNELGSGLTIVYKIKVPSDYEIEDGEEEDSDNNEENDDTDGN